MRKSDFAAGFHILSSQIMYVDINDSCVEINHVNDDLNFISISSNYLTSSGPSKTLCANHSVYFLFRKDFAEPLTVNSNG